MPIDDKIIIMDVFFCVINKFVCICEEKKIEMTDKSEADSERLAETISKFEDQIEDTKFAIATLRIELAFRIMIKIA